MKFNYTTNRLVGDTSPDITARYYKDVRKCKQLTGDEQLRIVIEYQQTKDKGKREQLRNQIINANQLFISSCARHLTDGDDFNDLVDEATFAIINAMEKFDTERENNFLTYATHYIRKHMVNYQTTINRLVKPKNANKIYAYVETERNRFFCENGWFPNEDELNERLAKRGQEFANKQDLVPVRITSLDCDDEWDKNDTNVEETRNMEFNNVTASENDYNKKVNDETLVKMVESALSKVSKERAEILKMYYGINCREMTFSEIALKLGKEEEFVRNEYQNAMKKLKSLYRKKSKIYKLCLD